MKKGIVSVVMAMAFAMSTVSVGLAAKVKCTVDSVSGKTVTMTCKKAKKLKAGMKVKVRLPRAKVAIEGC